MSKELIVTFTAVNKKIKESLEKDFDVIYDTDLDDILIQILDENDIEEDDRENWELSDSITSGEDIHKNYLTKDEIFEYADAYDSSSYDIDVINAAIDCDVNLSDIDESYNGKHDSDADFAEQMADDFGAVPKDAQWPLTCIDWDQAARELMYDYCSSNDHYFRNF